MNSFKRDDEEKAELFPLQRAGGCCEPVWEALAYTGLGAAALNGIFPY